MFLSRRMPHLFRLIGVQLFKVAHAKGVYMISTLVSHCDCCGLSIGPQVGDACPRCDYPVTLPKEERFLESSVHDLQRVAAYGGANMTVIQLMQRYRARLHQVQHLKQAPTPLVEKAKAVEAP